jgi:hypothetical protein
MVKLSWWHKSDYAKAGVQINNNDLIILCSSASTDGDFTGGSGNPDIWLAKFHNCDNNTVTKASLSNSVIETNTIISPLTLTHFQVQVPFHFHLRNQQKFH